MVDAYACHCRIRLKVKHFNITLTVDELHAQQAGMLFEIFAEVILIANRFNFNFS